MIPKKIHYCWFGDKPYPENVRKCIESWKKYCPDYEIIEWNQNNFDVNKVSYTREAYQAMKYAFVSDYVRLDVVYRYGGIYLDTDVELVRNIDDLLVNSCFMGCELPGRVATGVGFGAEKENKWILNNKNIYLDQNFIKNGTQNMTTCVEYTMKSLNRYKYICQVNDIQYIDDLVIYPTEYFCPFNMVTRKMKITQNTYSIHHYDASWKNKNALSGITLTIKVYARRFIDKIFGEGRYNQIKKAIKRSDFE